MLKSIRKKISRTYPIVKPIAQLKGWKSISYISSFDSSYQTYAIYIPQNINLGKPNPLIVALHGKEGTIFEFAFTKISKIADEFGLIIVTPKGRGNPMYKDEGERDVLGVIRDVRSKYSIDDKRIFILGASMGGYGATYIGFRNPELFAGIASIYGTITADELVSFIKCEKKLPVFIAHGEKDEIVPVNNFRELAARLDEIGWEYKCKILPKLGHDLKVLDLSLSEVLDFFSLSHNH